MGNSLSVFTTSSSSNNNDENGSTIRVRTDETDVEITPTNTERNHSTETSSSLSNAPPLETTQTESEKLSKRKQKRLAKEAQIREQKRIRREHNRATNQARKATKRAERAAALANLTLEEREKVEHERITKMRAIRAEEREERTRVRECIINCEKYGVCIDLGWNCEMSEKERKSLARQLSYSYSSLRKCVCAGLNPVALSIVGLDDDMKLHLSNAARGWNAWPIKVTPKSLGDVYGEDGGDGGGGGGDMKRLVYLTHDSENVLEELDENCVYVIGGIVDRNRLKGVTAEKAQSLGIRTARFNLDEFVRLQKGTRVLTVNHCVDILIRVANGVSWNNAYLQVLPTRKGVSCDNRPNGVDADSGAVVSRVVED